VRHHNAGWARSLTDADVNSPLFPVGARLLAFARGVILGIELAFWHKSIALIGVGLATVLANVQVVVVATVAWVLYGERPGIGTFAIIGGILMGVALTSGLARPDAYGSAPVAGVALGAFAGGCYAIFLLMFRAANRALAPTAGPLLDSTVGMTIGALLCAPFDPGFAFAPSWPAHAWLALLALVSQVIGWLLIAQAAAAAARARDVDSAARSTSLRAGVGRAVFRRTVVGASVARRGARAGGSGITLRQEHHEQHVA